MTEIENIRLHESLAPKFDMKIINDASGYKLLVEMLPGTLIELDSVQLDIMDERFIRHGSQGKVWSPWKFNTGASAQVSSDRSTIPEAYSLLSGRNTTNLGLELTDINLSYDSQLLRILITCKLEGYKDWHLYYGVRYPAADWKSTASNPS